jgi:uroporphyrinogen-III decarboxylase
MTARERMRTALDRGKTDRVPIAMAAEFDFYCKAAGRPMWEFEYGDNVARAAIQRDAHLRFPDSDFICCWSGVDRETAASRRVVMENGVPHLENTVTGERSPITPRATAAEWGVTDHSRTSETSWKNPIAREADIERSFGPFPTAQEVAGRGILEPIRLLRDDLGDDAYLAVPAHGAFPAAVDAVGGFERGMMMLRENPHLLRSVMEHLARRRSATLEVAARNGADAAWLGGYLEGADMISPEVWRSVVLPGHRIQVEDARRCGLQVLFWFLGGCMPLLDDLVELGIDGLVIEQDRRGYSSDPIEIRRRIGKNICVYGWNWELDFINGRRGNITREVERQINGAGADGAFVMGTTYMTSEVQLEAVDHFCQEVVRVSREAGY